MMSTIEIAEAVQDYVASLYEGLFSAVPLLIVGLVIFAVGMTILAHALTKKLHPMEASTRIIVRILTGLALVAACVFACFDVPNHGGIIGIAVLIAASVVAIFGLVKGARWTKYVIVASSGSISRRLRSRALSARFRTATSSGPLRPSASSVSLRLTTTSSTMP